MMKMGGVLPTGTNPQQSGFDFSKSPVYKWCTSLNAQDQHYVFGNPSIAAARFKIWKHQTKGKPVKALTKGHSDELASGPANGKHAIEKRCVLIAEVCAKNKDKNAASTRAYYKRNAKA